MLPDETVTARFPVGTNDPKPIKLVSPISMRQLDPLLVELRLASHESPYNFEWKFKGLLANQHDSLLQKSHQC